MSLKLITLVIAISGLLSFSWARRNFFIRREGGAVYRGGLAPLGSIFGIIVVFALAAKEVRNELDANSVVAVIMFLFSVLLFWWAARAFQGDRPSIAFSPGAPARLVTSGPYRYVRHPFYSAYMLFWLAFAVSAWNMFALVPALVMGIIYYRAASKEEYAILNSDLRDEYLAYSRSTGMFFPLIG